MPYYGYRGLDASKKSLTGAVWGLDEAHARQQLTHLSHLFLKPPSRWAVLMEHYKPTSRQEAALCCRQLAIMLAAGVNLSAALDMVLRQPLGRRLYAAYRRANDMVQGGSSLSQAMRKSPGVFDAFMVGLTRVGEETGTLTENLNQAADHMERENALRAKVAAALTYPALVTVVSLLMAYGVTQHVLPRFINGMFGQSGVPLPWFTQVLVAVTNFLSRPFMGPTLLGLALAAGVLGWKQLSTDQGQQRLYELLMSWKPTRQFFGTVLAVRTARMLATAVEAGMTVSGALQLTAESCANPYLRHHLEVAVEDLADGNQLSACVRAIPFMPVTMGGFVELGEQASGLGPTLLKAAQLMELDVESAIETFSQLLEPALVGFMGLFVGFILVALFLPMYSMLSAV